MEICGKLFGPNSLRGGADSGTLRRRALMSACSACAGDYEDPDHTAWGSDGGEVEDVGATRAEGEELLADS